MSIWESSNTCCVPLLHPGNCSNGSADGADSLTEGLVEGVMGKDFFDVVEL